MARPEERETPFSFSNADPSELRDVANVVLEAARGLEDVELGRSTRSKRKALRRLYQGAG